MAEGLPTIIVPVDGISEAMRSATEETFIQNDVLKTLNRRERVLGNVFKCEFRMQVDCETVSELGLL